MSDEKSGAVHEEENRAVNQPRVIVMVGSGGVGKTTSAAALAVGLADSGLRTVVLTIDPAKRLAQAMGLDELGGAPQPVAGLAHLVGNGRCQFHGILAPFAPRRGGKALKSVRLGGGGVAVHMDTQQHRRPLFGNPVHPLLDGAVLAVFPRSHRFEKCVLRQ